MELNFNSVETIANLNASAAFQVDSGKVFKDDVDICPVIIDKKLSYIPWGGDNNLPYHILDLIESDETLSTCQQFNAEVCYGSGLRYNVDESTKAVKQEVEDFLLDNAVTIIEAGDDIEIPGATSILEGELALVFNRI